MDRWRYEADSFVNENESQRLRVNSNVTGTRTIGGFIHRAGAMLFSASYNTITEAMEDLRIRSERGYYSMDPFPVTPEGDPYPVGDPKLIDKIKSGYTLDEEDADSIRRLSRTGGSFDDLVPEAEGPTT